MAAPRKYPQELRDRAIRLAKESDRPLAHIARDLGVHPEALRNWVRQDEADRGERADQVILRLAAEYGRGCAVVSSDREVSHAASAHGAFVIAAPEFASPHGPRTAVSAALPGTPRSWRTRCMPSVTRYTCSPRTSPPPTVKVFACSFTGSSPTHHPSTHCCR